MPVKIITLAFFCSPLWACDDPSIVVKEIQYKDARIAWYYKFLGDNRRDFVEARKGSQHEIVMDCTCMMITFPPGPRAISLHFKRSSNFARVALGSY